MSKLGQPFLATYEDSGFDKYMNRSFGGLSQDQASREWEEQTGYSYKDLVAHMEDSNVHSQAFTSTIAFSSDDYRTVSWAEGTIEYKDGRTTPAIAASDTGNMSARTYIYYDPQANKAALQTTTTASKAIGGERLLLAIAINDSDTSKRAELQTFGATGMYIASLVAGQIVVTQLDALTTSTGTLTVDEAINVGGTRIKFDGANNRILVSDASDGRIAFDNDGNFKISKNGKEVTTATGTDLALRFNPSTNQFSFSGTTAITGSLSVNGVGITGAYVGGQFSSYLNVEHSWKEENTYQDLTGALFEVDGDYFSNLNVYYEAVLMAEHADRTAYSRIYNITDSAALAGSEITTTSTSATRVRSSALTFPSGSKEYKVQIKLSQTGGEGDTAHLYVARLVYTA